MTMAHVLRRSDLRIKLLRRLMASQNLALELLRI